jgi:copper chaperone CopZ
MFRQPLAGLALLVAVGCSTADPPAVESSTAVPDSAASLGMTTVTFQVPTMTCPVGCPPAVRDALAALPGVTNVEVDFSSRTATCSVDQSRFDPDAAIQALAGANFDGSSVVP